MKDHREPPFRKPRAKNADDVPASHGAESRLPEVNSRRAPGGWDDGDEPFDFLLDLKELATRDASTKPAAPPHLRPAETKDAQSNIVTKPPPPFLPPPAFIPQPGGARPEPAQAPMWEEITPRSSPFAAAALLSAPHGSEPAPISDGPVLSPAPSTEPTGGRRAAPSTSGADEDRRSGLSPRRATGRLEEPRRANRDADGGYDRDADGDGYEENGQRRSGVDYVSPEESPPAVVFSPSFILDNAPVTRRGTHKVPSMNERDAKRSTWRQWGWMIAAAFLVPFVGGIVFSGWAESHRFKTTNNAVSPSSLTAGEEQNTLGSAASHGAPGEREPGALQGAASSALPAAPVDPVTLAPSLLGQPSSPGAVLGGAASGGDREARAGEDNRPATPHAAAENNAGRKPRSAQPRTVEEPLHPAPAGGAQLTQGANDGAPSYRVKIPEEQNSQGMRDGAHNVPVRE